MFYLKYTFKNIKNNVRPTLLSICVITLTFLLLNTLYFTWSNLQSITQSYGKNIFITAYLKNNLSGDEETSIINKIKSLNPVNTVIYESKKEAIRELSKAFSLNGPLIDDLNILPSSLKINLQEPYRNIQSVKTISNDISKINGIDDVQSGLKWITQYSAFSSLIKLIALIISSILVLTVIIIISTTLKLNFSSRKEEIDVLKFIGASPFFIRLPIYLEGFFQAIISVILATLGMQLIIKVTSLKLLALLNHFVPTMKNLEFMNLQFVGLIFIVALVSGFFGTRLALKKVKI